MSELVPYLQAAQLPRRPDDLVAAGIGRLAVNLTDYRRQPGFDQVAARGGLKRVLNWDGDLISFAGDFGELTRVKKNLATVGVHYQDPQTAAKLTLTADQAAEWQVAVGDCRPVALFAPAAYYAPVDDLKRAQEANASWARALPAGGLYPVIGGGLRALREASIAAVPAGCDYLIANLPPEEEFAEWQRVVDLTLELLPQGAKVAIVARNPAELRHAASRQIDWLISAWPIKAGLAGKALVKGEVVNLRHQEAADDFAPLQADCPCPACAGYQRATLHQLLHERVPLGGELLALHNLTQLARRLAEEAC